MTRTARTTILGCAAALVLGACADSLTDPPPPPRGPLIALASLRSVDGQALPCCEVDSAGAGVTISGGALSFYRFATYTDTVFTPGGAMSGACVQGLPNGAWVHLNGLVTLPDGTAYLLLPCTVGAYAVTLTKHLSGSAAQTTTQVTLSSGRYSWKRDTLTLALDAGTRFTTSMSDSIVTLTAEDHSYRFVAVPARD